MDIDIRYPAVGDMYIPHQKMEIKQGPGSESRVLFQKKLAGIRSYIPAAL